MSVHQHATLEDTVYLWFASNDVNGSGDNGATPVYDVRLAGDAAGADPVLSGAATLLTKQAGPGNFYPPGCHEVAIAATAGNGFAAGNTYAVFCTLLVDGQNPTGFVGSFTLEPLAKASVCTEARLAELDAANLPAGIAAIPLVVPDAAGTAAALHGDTDADIAALYALVVALENPTTAAIAANVWSLAATIDGVTPAEALQIIAAAIAGKLSGAGTGTEVVLGLDGITTRATATIDGSGNRTAVLY